MLYEVITAFIGVTWLQPLSDNFVIGAGVSYQLKSEYQPLAAVDEKYRITSYNVCYTKLLRAPPYSSAKDPVNQAGYVAENIITGRLKNINWKEVSQLHAPNICLLDVRTPEEHALGHIEGSLNIEVDKIRERMDEIPRDKKIIIYCGVGIRGYFACRILMQNGFEEVYNLSGGYKTYEHTRITSYNVCYTKLLRIPA